MKNQFVKLLSLAIVLGTLSACSGGGGGGSSGGGSSSGGGTVSQPSDPYYHAWFDVYGHQCVSNGYPMSGCNFYASGEKIKASGDPYYKNLTLYNDYWKYTDSYGYRRSYKGYAWFSTTGILYDSNGVALNEIDQDASQSADVLSQAADQEKAVSTEVGKALAQKYALAEDKGIMISKTLQDWAVIGKGRARTDADVADFSKRLYGLDADKAMGAFQRALATQSQKPVEELNVDVAAHWGTTPEVSKEILKSWYKAEVSAYGIK